MGVLGITANVVFAVVAVPFGAAAYFLWADATGRLQRRMRRRAAARARHRAADGGAGHSTPPDREDDPGPGGQTRAEARRVLGVGADAGTEEIKRAYRERVKAVHPDREGGSDEAFKRVRDAYERLT